MQQGMIRCPHCGHEFELSDALTGEIREHLRAELSADVSRREGEVEKKLRALKEQEKNLARHREAMDEEIARKLQERLTEAEQKAARKIEDKYATQFQEMQGVLTEKEAAIKAFREQEVELRRKQRQLEEAREAQELELARKLDEERGKIRLEVAKKIAEEHRLKDLEKEKVISDLKASVEDMKRKAEQGSMERQGEVFEQDLEAQLRSFFPVDKIQPVPKGIRGADIVQNVCDTFGVDCGLLVWETKNTKAWNQQWISVLKENMRAIRGTIAILVSVVLPEGVVRFGQLDGVWVSDPHCAIPLAAALREQLIAVNREQRASVGKNEKMDMLYQYLAGVEFKQKIEGIVEAFRDMHEQLSQERRAMEKHWNQREKQIHKVIKNTARLYGDMQGIIGGQIPVIPALELDGDMMKQLPDGTTEE